MRKHLALLLVAVMLLTLAACGGGEPNSSVPTLPEQSTAPVVTDPVVTEPLMSAPTVTDPSVTDIGTTLPSQAESSNVESTVTLPVSTQPSASQSSTTTPTSVSSVSSTTKLSTNVPIPTQSVLTQQTVTVVTSSATQSTTTTASVTTVPTKPSASAATTPSTTVTSAASTAPTSAAPLVNPEKPYIGNPAIKFDGQHSSIDEQAEEMRRQILNATDRIKPANGAVTYYVSFKGNDRNDGLSPETAWRSTEHVQSVVTNLEKGSTVLFERGGVYRGTMYVREGMSIGAYGTGPKPQLYGSLHNYADASWWKQTDTPNVWKLNFGTTQGDVGNIVFDHGKYCSSPGRVFSLGMLAKDFDYYYHGKSGTVYLYYSKGNPGMAFYDIEIVAQGVGAVLRRYVPDNYTNNVTIDNLCIRYANFGISFARCSNMTVTNCEIGWIGGCIQSGVTRYGNGIEFYGFQKDITVKNNWIYQCFDAGYTNQGGDYHWNVNVSENLIEYCHYNIEVFADDMVYKSVYEKNILRFPGYGFGSYKRTGSGTGQGGSIRTGSTGVPSNEFVIRDNIFDGGKFGLLFSPHYDGVRGPTYEGNTWIQTGDYPILTYISPGKLSADAQPGGSLEAMEKCIRNMDKTATIIYE